MQVTVTDAARSACPNDAPSSAYCLKLRVTLVNQGTSPVDPRGSSPSAPGFDGLTSAGQSHPVSFDSGMPTEVDGGQTASFNLFLHTTSLASGERYVTLTLKVEHVDTQTAIPSY